MVPKTRARARRTSSVFGEFDTTPTSRHDRSPSRSKSPNRDGPSQSAAEAFEGASSSPGALGEGLGGDDFLQLHIDTSPPDSPERPPAAQETPPAWSEGDSLMQRSSPLPGDTPKDIWELGGTSNQDGTSLPPTSSPKSGLDLLPDTVPIQDIAGPKPDDAGVAVENGSTALGVIDLSETASTLFRSSPFVSEGVHSNIWDLDASTRSSPPPQSNQDDGHTAGQDTTAMTSFAEEARPEEKNPTEKAPEQEERNGQEPTDDDFDNTQNPLEDNETLGGRVDLEKIYRFPCTQSERLDMQSEKDFVPSPRSTRSSHANVKPHQHSPIHQAQEGSNNNNPQDHPQTTTRDNHKAVKRRKQRAKTPIRFDSGDMAVLDDNEDKEASPAVEKPPPAKTCRKSNGKTLKTKETTSTKAPRPPTRTYQKKKQVNRKRPAVTEAKQTRKRPNKSPYDVALSPHDEPPEETGSGDQGQDDAQVEAQKEAPAANDSQTKSALPLNAGPQPDASPQADDQKPPSRVNNKTEISDSTSETALPDVPAPEIRPVQGDVEPSSIDRQMETASTTTPLPDSDASFRPPKRRCTRGDVAKKLVDPTREPIRSFLASKEDGGDTGPRPTKRAKLSPEDVPEPTPPRRPLEAEVVKPAAAPGHENEARVGPKTEATLPTMHEQVKGGIASPHRRRRPHLEERRISISEDGSPTRLGSESRLMDQEMSLENRARLRGRRRQHDKAKRQLIFNDLPFGSNRQAKGHNATAHGDKKLREQPEKLTAPRKDGAFRLANIRDRLREQLGGGRRREQGNAGAPWHDYGGSGHGSGAKGDVRQAPRLDGHRDGHREGTRDDGLARQMHSIVDVATSRLGDAGGKVGQVIEAYKEGTMGCVDKMEQRFSHEKADLMRQWDLDSSRFFEGIGASKKAIHEGRRERTDGVGEMDKGIAERRRWYEGASSSLAAFSRQAPEGKVSRPERKLRGRK